MKLLIVDDNPLNRKVLKVTLEVEGHTLLEAADGVEALEVLANETVDAVVSDILMPRMDGYRLCHELRTSERLRYLPIVIYTSTYTSMSDEKLALNIGADKYVRRPAPVQTILNAICDAIAMHHSAPRPEAQHEVAVLKQYSESLVTKLEEANIDLSEANERLTILDHSKNDFLKLIAHEFRTPLNGILGIAELVLEGMPTGDEKDQMTGVFNRCRRRILSILDDALLLTQIDVSGDRFRHAAPVSLGVVVSRAIAATGRFAKSRGVSLPQPAGLLDCVLGDEDLLVRALNSLLETAVKFCEAGESVQLSFDAGVEFRKVFIKTPGGSVPGLAMAKFFDLFSITEAITPGGDLGLGPPVASRILSLFGGSVAIANRVPTGITLTVSLRNAVTGVPNLAETRAGRERAETVMGG